MSCASVRWLLVPVSTLVFVLALVGQISFGRIAGRISDQSGAVVPGANVTAIEQNTNIARSIASDEQGRYVFPSLPPGKYKLQVQAQGFKTAEVAEVTLEVGQSVGIDVAMQIGTVTENVTVTAAAPLLAAQTGSLGQVVENRLVAELPLNGRNFQQLILLGPGSNGGSEPAINGSSPAKPEFYFDDGSVKYRNWQGSEPRGGAPLRPNIDMIQEFKIETSAMSAEYGRSGSTINVSTKSGTNAFHGTVFEFLRNDVLDARDPFQATVSPRKQNQFGGTIGGPVFKDKLFFFAAYEANRIRSGQSFNATVPTAQMRAGDFSQIRPLFDPATRRADPDRPGVMIADRFANNIIRRERLSRPGLFFQDFYELPNSGSQYVAAPSVPNDYDQGSIRVDSHLFQKGQLFTRYTRTDKRFDQISPFPKLNPVYSITDVPHQAVIGYNHIFGPHLLGELRLNIFRTNLRFDNRLLGTDFMGQAGIRGFEDIQTQPEFKGFPRISISGYQLLDSGLFAPIIQQQRTWQVKGNITRVAGGHVLKSGFDVRHERVMFWQTLRTHGDFAFDGQYTANPASPAGTGDAFADFLLGLPSVGRRSFELDLYGDVWKSWHFYVQDDWKVTPNLTLNLGLRYEYSPPAVPNTLGAATFDTDIDPARGRIIVSSDDDGRINFSAQRYSERLYNLFREFFVTTKDVGLPSSLSKSHKRDFAPRFGFAWRPAGNSNTVIRGGYGIFYIVDSANFKTFNISTIPFGFPENINNTAGIPNRTFENFFLGVPFPAALGLPSINAISQLYLFNPYEQEWNFGMQRALPGQTTVELAYVGKKGTHLEHYPSLNVPTPGEGAVQQRRPFPRFSSGSWMTRDGSSNYNSLQVRAERRFARGLSFLSSYTWSKAIGDVSGDGGGVPLQDVRNRRGSRGLLAWDVAHRVVGSFVYQIPFPKVSTSWVNTAFGNWQLGGILTLQGGSPFTPNITLDRANVGRGDQRPDRLGSGEGPKTLAKWFEPTDFVIPAQFTFGNSGANILRADGLNNFDFSLAKNFPIKEAVTLQFRSEFFNMFNHPDYAAPVSSINVGTAGRVLGVAGAGPRNIQFGLKLLF